MDFRTIAVLGAGAMGSGIAQLLAQCGFAVNLCDRDSKILGESAANIRRRLDAQAQRGNLSEAELKAAHGALRTVESLAEACAADLIIEAVPEKIELKKSLFTGRSSGSHQCSPGQQHFGARYRPARCGDRACRIRYRHALF